MVGLSGIAADVDAQLILANSIGLKNQAELTYDQVIHTEATDTASIPPSRLIQHLQDSGFQRLQCIRCQHPQYTGYQRLQYTGCQHLQTLLQVTTDLTTAV